MSDIREFTVDNNRVLINFDKDLVTINGKETKTNGDLILTGGEVYIRYNGILSPFFQGSEWKDILKASQKIEVAEVSKSKTIYNGIEYYVDNGILKAKLPNGHEVLIPAGVHKFDNEELMWKAPNAKVFTPIDKSSIHRNLTVMAKHHETIQNSIRPLPAVSNYRPYMSVQDVSMRDTREIDLGRLEVPIVRKKTVLEKFALPILGFALAGTFAIVQWRMEQYKQEKKLQTAKELEAKLRGVPSTVQPTPVLYKEPQQPSQERAPAERIARAVAKGGYKVASDVVKASSTVTGSIFTVIKDTVIGIKNIIQKNQELAVQHKKLDYELQIALNKEDTKNKADIIKMKTDMQKIATDAKNIKNRILQEFALRTQELKFKTLQGKIEVVKAYTTASKDRTKYATIKEILATKIGLMPSQTTYGLKKILEEGENGAAEEIAAAEEEIKQIPDEVKEEVANDNENLIKMSGEEQNIISQSELVEMQAEKIEAKPETAQIMKEQAKVTKEIVAGTDEEMHAKLKADILQTLEGFGDEYSKFITNSRELLTKAQQELDKEKMDKRVHPGIIKDLETELKMYTPLVDKVIETDHKITMRAMDLKVGTPIVEYNKLRDDIIKLAQDKSYLIRELNKEIAHQTSILSMSGLSFHDWTIAPSKETPKETIVDLPKEEMKNELEDVPVEAPKPGKAEEIIKIEPVKFYEPPEKAPKPDASIEALTTLAPKTSIEASEKMIKTGDAEKKEREKLLDELEKK